MKGEKDKSTLESTLEATEDSNRKNPLNSKRSPAGCMTVTNLSDSLSRTYEKERKSLSRSVSFGYVKIRSYNRTVGVNPSVSSGPALDFSWEFVTHKNVLLDDFEPHRECTRRDKVGLVIRRRDREKILRFDFEVSAPRIAKCVRTINRTKSQRRQTLHNMKFQGIEESFEAIKRRTLRLVGFKKTTELEIARLWKDSKKNMEKFNRKSSNESLTLANSIRSFSSSIFDDSRKGKASRSRNVKKKKITPKDPSLDKCKHVVRYSLDLDGNEGSNNNDHSDSTPTASNIELVNLHDSQDEDHGEDVYQNTSKSHVSEQVEESQNSPLHNDGGSAHVGVRSHSYSNGDIAIDQTNITCSTVAEEPETILW
jgi:hypothetical protein